MDEHHDDERPAQAAATVFGPPSAADATFAPTVEHLAPPGTAGSPADDDATGDDDQDAGGDRRRVSFATKALIVAAVWVLLVLFLVGQFSDDDDPGAGPVGLDQTTASDASGADAPAAGDQDEPAVDVDGDGEIEPGEPGYEALAGGNAAESGGGTAGSGGSAVGVPVGGGGGGGTQEPSGGGADPVALPGAATTTTVKGGTKATTSTTAAPGPTSTSPPSTTTTAATQPPAPLEVTVHRDPGGSDFSTSSVELARGQSIRFVNPDDSTHVLDVPGQDNLTIPAGGEASFTFSAAGAYVIDCVKSGHAGKLLVTVS